MSPNWKWLVINWLFQISNLLWPFTVIVIPTIYILWLKFLLSTATIESPLNKSLLNDLYMDKYIQDIFYLQQIIMLFWYSLYSVSILPYFLPIHPLKCMWYRLYHFYSCPKYNLNSQKIWKCFLRINHKTELNMKSKCLRIISQNMQSQILNKWKLCYKNDKVRNIL